MGGQLGILKRVNRFIITDTTDQNRKMAPLLITAGGTAQQLIRQLTDNGRRALTLAACHQLLEHTQVWAFAQVAAAMRSSTGSSGAAVR